MMRNLHPIIYSLCLLVVSCNQAPEQKNHTEGSNHTGEQPRFAHVNYEIPDSMKFCGEWISFQDLDIRERLDRELLVNMNFHSSTMLYIKRAHRFFPEMVTVLKANQLPEDLKYLAVAESGLAQVTSGAGARGFWQFMPETAREFNLTVNNWVDERLNVAKSTIAACRYLKNAYRTFGNWSLAVASYNRGVRGVNADMEWQDSEDYFDTYMNVETGRYLFRILAIKLIMEDPMSFGFNLEGMELYEPYQTKTVAVADGIENISEWANGQGVNYKIVKLLNPWILKNELPQKDTFNVLLPDEHMNLKPISAYK